MKNYRGLYPNTPLNKKVNPFNKTPNKNKSRTGNVITTKTSHKTLLPYSPLTRQKRTHERTLTRSIDQMQINSESDGQDPHFYREGKKREQEQLFSQSYSKIGQLRKEAPPRNIDAELNEVLGLIRQEKAAINQKMKALKKSNEQYKQISENFMRSKTECGCNTDDILPSGRESGSVDRGVGSEQIKIEEEPQTQNSDDKQEQPNVQNSQCYLRICGMLQQMKINPKEILPCEQQMPAQILIRQDYNGLSERQVIQIQKFFIKKLIQRLNT